MVKTAVSGESTGVERHAAHPVRRRPWIVRNARLLLAWGIFLALFFIYYRDLNQFTPREA